MRPRRERDGPHGAALLRLLAAATLVCAIVSLLQFGSITERSAGSASLREHYPQQLIQGTQPPTTAPKPQRGKAQPPTTAPKPSAPAVREPPVRVERGSKGIVLCLHNHIIPLGASLIRELRCLGNSEPIEIYHCSELSTGNMDLLHAIDDRLEIIDICSRLVEAGVMDEALAHSFRSYWIKPLALHQTKFDEPILLDADVVALKDPASLRQVPGYKTNGTVFFYDRVIRDANFFNRWVEPSPGADKVHYLPLLLKTFDYARFNITEGYAPSYRVLTSWGYNDETCHEQDSSMLLIDKQRAGRALTVLWFLITEHRFNVEFSLGDKESYWLAYELAHAPYFFSPWGASVVSSQPNRDVERYEATLCGCLCHYTPVRDESPELLYLNGRQVVDPVPFPLDRIHEVRRNLVFNMLPTHMSPRRKRAHSRAKDRESYDMECNIGLGKTPTPAALRHHLWRRRLHFLALSMGLLEPLKSCDMGGPVTLFDRV